MSVRDFAVRVAGAAWLRAAGVACIIAVAILSLVPEELKADVTEVIHGNTQHVVAYLGTAIVIGLGAKRRLNPAMLIVPLAAYAGLLEILQHWAPGRNPEVAGVVWSSLGAAFGAMLAYALRHP